MAETTGNLRGKGRERPAGLFRRHTPGLPHCVSLSKEMGKQSLYTVTQELKNEKPEAWPRGRPLASASRPCCPCPCCPLFWSTLLRSSFGVRRNAFSAGLPCHARLGWALHQVTVFSQETEGTHWEGGRVKTGVKTAVAPPHAGKGHGLLGTTGGGSAALTFL